MGYKMPVHLIAIVVMIFCTGCHIGSNITKGELKYQINSDNSLTFSGYLSNSDIQLFLPIELDATNETIIERINNYYESKNLIVNVIEFKKKNNYGYFELRYPDPELLYLKINNTLEDYAVTNYGSFEEMSKWEVLLDYNNEEIIKISEWPNSQTFAILTVNGSSNGVYYEVPGEIHFVSDEMDYRRITSNLIYVESAHFGIIVYSNDHN